MLRTTAHRMAAAETRLAEAGASTPPLEPRGCSPRMSASIICRPQPSIRKLWRFCLHSEVAKVLKNLKAKSGMLYYIQFSIIVLRPLSNQSSIIVLLSDLILCGDIINQPTCTCTDLRTASKCCALDVRTLCLIKS